MLLESALKHLLGPRRRKKCFHSEAQQKPLKLNVVDEEEERSEQIFPRSLQLNRCKRGRDGGEQISNYWAFLVGKHFIVSADR
jgi:hypothetical protein